MLKSGITAMVLLIRPIFRLSSVLNLLQIFDLELIYDFFKPRYLVEEYKFM
jgi:hypothetical protein